MKEVQSDYGEDILQSFMVTSGCVDRNKGGIGEELVEIIRNQWEGRMQELLKTLSIVYLWMLKPCYHWQRL